MPLLSSPLDAAQARRRTRRSRSRRAERRLKTVTTPKVAPVQQTPAQLQTGDYNADTLNADMVTSYNALPGDTAVSAQCVIAGQDAQCLMTDAEGLTVVEDVTISADGTNFIFAGH